MTVEYRRPKNNIPQWAPLSSEGHGDDTTYIIDESLSDISFDETNYVRNEDLPNGYASFDLVHKPEKTLWAKIKTYIGYIKYIFTKK